MRKRDLGESKMDQKSVKKDAKQDDYSDYDFSCKLVKSVVIGRPMDDY